MRLFLSGGFVLFFAASPALAQQSASLQPKPVVVSADQATDLSKFDHQLVQLPAAKVVHADTAQVFLFGERDGRQAHVIVPAPAIDSAHVGDMVEVIGWVRRYTPKDFEHDYSWFKQADYPDVHAGDWVIVANSVRTPEGTQLVPGNTVSDMPPDTKKTSPPSKQK
jgi:hypothetical protein